MNRESCCRNCGEREFYLQKVSARGGYGPDLLPIGGFFRSPAFQLRVCGVCGLVDWFVPPEHLTKVRERFTREDSSTAPH